MKHTGVLSLLCSYLDDFGGDHGGLQRHSVQKKDGKFNVLVRLFDTPKIASLLIVDLVYWEIDSWESKRYGIRFSDTCVCRPENRE
jgi:hypothetical protein